MVGVTDLLHDSGQLVERALLCRRGHPIDRMDVFAHRAENFISELRVTLLGLRSEILLNVELAERVAEVSFFCIEHALETFPLLRRAVQDRAEEVEVLGIELPAGFVGEGMSE